MNRFAVVGDVHGNYQLLHKLLHEIGEVDAEGRKLGNWEVIQLGDLVNCAPSPPHHSDITTVRKSQFWLDEVLIGNHELFYLFSHMTGMFGGITFPIDLELSSAMQSARNPIMTVSNIYCHPTAFVGDWLISHAGLHPHYQDEVTYHSTMTLSLNINSLFGDTVDGEWPSMFSAFGPMRSGGQDRRAGGIFWCDAREMKQMASGNRIKQIVGHTPAVGSNGFMNGPELHKSPGEPIWFIDAGPGKLSALLTEDVGENWKLVTVAETHL